VQACGVSHTTVNAKDTHIPCQVEIKRLSKKIFQSFNTWAFKRQQPTEPGELLRFVERAVTRSGPIHFVLYWGKGPRSTIADPERDCLRFLSQMGERIRAEYPPGAHFTLIATDTHATHNGHSASDIRCYFTDLAALATPYDFTLRYLSDIVDIHKDRLIIAAPKAPTGLLDKLQPCAEKWYRGEGAVLDGAVQYYEMNMVEKQAVEMFFPHSIFVTFNNSQFRELFPELLPVFYMYSMRKGISVKPWFVDGGQTSAHQTETFETAAVAG